ncbi:hypothetical protein HMPREF9946_01563 [Acetobacteraceae bacterium AT-5844]|nr:hypothetical protein HMPREF9946_01563 [Acetobacteraceae bacterium AT-5844]
MVPEGEGISSSAPEFLDSGGARIPRRRAGSRAGGSPPQLCIGQALLHLEGQIS